MPWEGAGGLTYGYHRRALFLAVFCVLTEIEYK